MACRRILQLWRGLGPAGAVLINNHIRLTGDVATCMFYTGVDPFTKKPVHVACNLRDRKLQWALMQFFKPEN
jgi:hypothetical protein